MSACDVAPVAIFADADDPQEVVGDEGGRGKGIGRTLRIVAALLQGRELSVDDVIEMLQIQVAGANRQMKSFERELANVGLRVRTTPAGRLYSLPLPNELGARPTVAMAIAACFASSLAPLFDQTQYGAAMRDATKRIVDRAKRAVSSKDIDRKFFFHVRGGEVALPREAAALTTIVNGLLECTWLRLTYTDFEGQVHRKLDVKPLSITVHEHQLYLVAESKTRPLHPYRFSRIKSAELLATRFEYPPRTSFDPKQVFENSIGVFLDPTLPIIDAVVRLAPRWKTYVSGHRWHHSQTVVDDDEHGVVVRLHVRHCKELEQWILSFGEDAEVLAPPDLRRNIARRVAAASTKYAGG